MSRTVYLVGSVPLPDAASVFRTVGTALGSRLRRLPDGEAGARLDWVMRLSPTLDVAAVQGNAE